MLRISNKLPPPQLQLQFKNTYLLTFAIYNGYLYIDIKYVHRSFKKLVFCTVLFLAILQ